ncbi:MAG: hypothetical protein FJW37_10415 [Acidobacteria bacterium]|nr:hypothetical protein [Acidobacteriota bacterium]
MPFCSHCGIQVQTEDLYCARCGSRQPCSTTTVREPLERISPRTASILCYIPLVGWVPALMVLASNKFRAERDVRFHAFQGLYLFVAWLVVDAAISPVFRGLPGPNFAGSLLRLALVGAWVFMLVKTSQDQRYSLPVIGELAEKSVAERSE